MIKIRLETASDAKEFSDICSQSAKNSGEFIRVVDGQGLSVNAKSFLGMLHAMEFSSLYVETNVEIAGKILKFIVD